MDLDKEYFDVDGIKCNILEMVKREPEWAANRLQEGEKYFEEPCRLRAKQEKQDRADFERKAQDKADAQAKRQAEQDTQQKEKERIATEQEAKRQAGLLPDKEKLIAFSNILANLELPRLKNEGARKILNEISIRIIELAESIKGQAERM